MRLLVASLLAAALALGLMSFVAIFGRVLRAGWWWASLLPNIGICLCIVHTMFGCCAWPSAGFRRRWWRAWPMCATSARAWR